MGFTVKDTLQEGLSEGGDKWVGDLWVETYRQKCEIVETGRKKKKTQFESETASPTSHLVSSDVGG